MATKIQMRRDTEANWLKADPVLMAGEMALVSENATNPVYDRFKIGNGVSKFSELPYLKGQQIDIVQGKGTSTEKVMSQKAVTDLLSAGYLFLGMADTETIPYSNVEVLQNKVFYIAIENGTYTRFGNKVKQSAASLMVLMSSDSGRTWTSEESADLSADISDLAARVSIGKASVWISGETESPGDVSIYDLGTVIWRKDRNTLVEVVQSTTGGKEIGEDYGIEDDRIYVYGGNLCYWDGTKFVPFLLDGINTLKSKARYEYSLSKILALTDTSAESAVEEAFTPTYAPDGNTTPRVPKAGDLLINGNNTVVVSEGTQIFFSFTYYEEIISMRVFSTGSNFKFNVWKFPAGTVYDFNSIDTLTESSTADDIKEALTPKIGDGMRIPNSGDIMLIGIEENPDTVSVLYRYRNTFAYYSNRLLTTIEVKGEDDSLSVVKTVSKNYVYDFDKINALTTASTFSDIMHAFSPLIIATEGVMPKTGDLLTSGYDEEGNAARSAKVICHNGDTFAYCYDSKHVTVKLVGEYLGSPDMRVEKTVTDLKNAKVFDLTKIDALTGSSSSADIQAAFTVDGNQSVPQVGDILRTNSTDYPYNDIVVYAQSTDNIEGIKSFKYLSGTTIKTVQVMPDFSAVNVTETELEKEVLKINAIGTQSGIRSVELGVTYQQLKEAIADNKIIKDTYGTIYSARGTDTLELKKVEENGGFLIYAVLSIPPYSGTTASVTSKESILTPNIQLPAAFLEGELNGTDESIGYGDLITALGVFGIACDSDGIIYNAKVTGGGRGNTVLSAVKDANTYVSYTIGMSDNGGLKLTARTVIPNTGIYALPIKLNGMVGEEKAVDIGITLDELANLIDSGVIRAVSTSDGCIFIATTGTGGDAKIVALQMETTAIYASKDNHYIQSGIAFLITDAGSGKVDITKFFDFVEAPCVDETGKLPAEVLPDSAKELLFRDLWDEACASYGKYNAATGFYELNGLTDITYGQALSIYNAGVFRPVAGNVETRQYSSNTKIRTNLPYYNIFSGYSGQLPNYRLLFFGCTSLEAVRLMMLPDYSEGQAIQLGNVDMMFYNCKSLRKVYSVLNFSTATNTANTFYGCEALEEIRIGGLNASLSLSSSPNLSKKSVLYLVENSAATEAITVTLHPTAYAMAMADTDIQEALKAKTNVSLASA